MNISGIDHIALNAVNCKRTVNFYRDILGFKQLNTVEQPEFKSIYLEIPGGARMEIFDNRGATKKYPLDDLSSGVKHIAFRVEDVKKHELQLKENGVSMLMATTELEDFNARIILFKDPDGVIIEFCEPLN